MARARVLVVEDRESMRRLLERVLGEAYAVESAADGAAALQRLAQASFDLVLTDVRMPGADGFEVLQAVKQRTPDTEVILMTAFASIPRAVEAVRAGAYDYLSKPFDPDDLVLLVARALERRSLRLGSTGLGPALRALFPSAQGSDATPAQRALLQGLARAAGEDAPLLLSGEPGTGKAHTARVLHEQGARRGGPFVQLEAARLPPQVSIDAAFAAAAALREAFAQARGGTLYVSDVDVLTAPLQADLERGAREPVRLVLGTCAPLPLPGLRVAASALRLPPLRERPEDIGPLALLASSERAPALQGFEPEALQALVRYAWPHNVRELHEAVAQAAAAAPGPRVRLEDLPAPVARAHREYVSPAALLQVPFREAVDRAREEASREYLQALLQQFRGNVTHAAEHAGMERESLHRLLKRHGLRSEDFKGSR